MASPTTPRPRTHSLFRRAAATTLALGAIAFAAGCGSADSDSATSSTAAYQAVTVDHAFGQTVVSHKPTRIVSLSPTFTDALVALDTKPAGYLPNPMTNADYAWDQGNSNLAGVTKLPLGPGGTVPEEKIAALQPDLILGGGLILSKDEYDKLSKLAPTIPSLKAGALDSWQDDTTLVGKLLGREADAKPVVAATDKALADAKAKYPKLAGKTFAVSLFVDATNIEVITNPDDNANKFFQSLGMKLPDALHGLSGGLGGLNGKISMEKLDLLSSDLLSVGYMTPGAAAQLEDQPLFKQLPAVQHGTYLATDADVSSALRLPTARTTAWLLTKFDGAFGKL
ncbi:ABC transporter substrate-binding protein [Nocardia macrotermitis]|uniref:Fe(3+)-citrate-binding protein YfmC n=1 Tax=Nocardia macrotermitis TaxID=2585198 RepID=A0A7K0DCR2_9NOCA|nr:ABC transporter substrate-binding protein [Nocardia macrotermitis]MQY23112.1 Fe(3+)-citrate-binding protein YfmC [Nocardia macrotermitis]